MYHVSTQARLSHLALPLSCLEHTHTQSISLSSQNSSMNRGEGLSGRHLPSDGTNTACSANDAAIPSGHPLPPLPLSKTQAQHLPSGPLRTSRRPAPSKSNFCSVLKRVTLESSKVSKKWLNAHQSACVRWSPSRQPARHPFTGSCAEWADFSKRHRSQVSTFFSIPCMHVAPAFHPRSKCTHGNARLLGKVGSATPHTLGWPPLNWTPDPEEGRGLTRMHAWHSTSHCLLVVVMCAWSAVTRSFVLS